MCKLDGNHFAFSLLPFAHISVVIRSSQTFSHISLSIGWTSARANEARTLSSNCGRPAGRSVGIFKRLFTCPSPAYGSNRDSLIACPLTMQHVEHADGATQCVRQLSKLRRLTRRFRSERLRARVQSVGQPTSQLVSQPVSQSICLSVGHKTIEGQFKKRTWQISGQE